MDTREFLLAGAIVTVVLFGLLAGPPGQRVLAVDANGTTAIRTAHLREAVENGQDPLAPVERDSIRTVAARERATAATLDALAGQHPALTGLAAAEHTHAAAVQVVLDRYGLAAEEPGSVQAAATSAAALRRAAGTVEQDIATLREQQRRTDNPDVRQVYHLLA
ncbi:MAG: hypothetical protein ABEK12_00730, partial [Candidatus Nanohaloarchaea archaeon]